MKSGTATLVLTGPNSYSGGTSVNQGTLQIGNAATNGTIGTGAYSVANGGKLYLNYATAATPTWANIAGGGTLELYTADGGDWGWASLPTGFTGTLAIDKGRLDIAGSSSLGNATTVIVQNGGQFGDWSGGTFSQNFFVAGTGWGEGGYAVAIRGGDSSTTLNGSVTLTAATGLGSGGNLVLNGTLTAEEIPCISVIAANAAR